MDCLKYDDDILKNYIMYCDTNSNEPLSSLLCSKVLQVQLKKYRPFSHQLICEKRLLRLCIPLVEA